jgi:hypothetical protein
VHKSKPSSVRENTEPVSGVSPQTFPYCGLNVFSFVKCPFCSGHEAVSPEAAALIEQAIDYELHERGSELSPALIAELENIRNVILNTQERETVDPLLT